MVNLCKEYMLPLSFPSSTSERFQWAINNGHFLTTYSFLSSIIIHYEPSIWATTTTTTKVLLPSVITRCETRPSSTSTALFLYSALIVPLKFGYHIWFVMWLAQNQSKCKKTRVKLIWATNLAIRCLAFVGLFFLILSNNDVMRATVFIFRRKIESIIKITIILTT